MNYVTNQYVRFEVWGKYDEANVSKATHNGTTRELIKSKKQQSGVPAGKNLPKVALDMWRKVRIIVADMRHTMPHSYLSTCCGVRSVCHCDLS